MHSGICRLAEFGFILASSSDNMAWGWIEDGLNQNAVAQNGSEKASRWICGSSWRRKTNHNRWSVLVFFLLFRKKELKPNICPFEFFWLHFCNQDEIHDGSRVGHRMGSLAVRLLYVGFSWGRIGSKLTRVEHANQLRPNSWQIQEVMSMNNSSNCTMCVNISSSGINNDGKNKQYPAAYQTNIKLLPKANNWWAFALFA